MAGVKRTGEGRMLSYKGNITDASFSDISVNIPSDVVEESKESLE